MGRLLALLAGFAPRVVLVLIWIFSNLVDRAFDGFVIPLLGLIFFPYATLFYVIAYSPIIGGLSGWGWVFVVIGFIFDIGHWGWWRGDRSAALCQSVAVPTGAPSQQRSGASATWKKAEQPVAPIARVRRRPGYAPRGVLLGRDTTRIPSPSALRCANETLPNHEQ